MSREQRTIYLEDEDWHALRLAAAREYARRGSRVTVSDLVEEILRRSKVVRDAKAELGT